jgi:hypothetical protein
MNTQTNNKVFCDLEMGQKQHSPSDVQRVKCKRKYDDAFSETTYDDTRYAQHIGQDFFKNNYGNNYCNLESLEKGEVFHPDSIKELNDRNGNRFDVEEILTWCQYYLSNRNLFKI